MTNTNQTGFDCQLYVSARGKLNSVLPFEAGPKKVITFAPVEFDQLIEPSFRRLLAELQAVPQPLRIVQVS